MIFPSATKEASRPARASDLDIAAASGIPSESAAIVAGFPATGTDDATFNVIQTDVGIGSAIESLHEAPTEIDE